MYCPILCFAWGFKGHQAIAQIAEQHLTSTTKIALQPIQYKTTFEQLSIWPDTIRRSTPLTTHWHYVTLSTQQWPALPLKNQGQLYTALWQQMKMLTDDQSIHWQDRHQALSWVIHLVGDAHQPLHINQGQDQGGNRCTVHWLTRKKPVNLHKVWDTLLVKETLKLNKLEANYRIAITDKINSNEVFSFGRDYGHYGRILNQAVVARSSLAVRNENEIMGYCFTPQDGNSLLSSLAITEWFLYPNSYVDKIQCLKPLFFDEV